MTSRASSPSSSGPAGAHFEGQVGAFYLLTMLTGADPRGLPGATIDRVAFQRAGEGFPLDDVVVHAHGACGEAAVLEIQVKRAITFAPQDTVFKAVVEQIAEASLKPEFDTTRYELAIATSQSSRQIDGPYQDVLTWARKIGDSATFSARIKRKGSGNEDMRCFVRTFKAHLGDAGVPNDDENVWRLLRRLHILVFDFTASGSVSNELACERAVRILHRDHASRARELWSVLIDTALETAASGGDRNRETLEKDLGQRSFRFSGEHCFRSARAAIAEASKHALEDIHDRVGNVTLTRYAKVTRVQEALDKGRYVEIRGDAGVGKSGVLKHFARQIQDETQVLVLSPTRTFSGGWTAMRGTLGFDGSARELLSDMASDGAAIIFVDNLDFFSEAQQTTVRDLVREASDIPGVSVIVTARRDFGKEEPNWLPAEALSRLGHAPFVVIEELDNTEVGELRSLAPDLVPLLADSHPARDVTRNLFRLNRLASLSRDEPVPCTEVELAQQWWATADGRLDGTHRNRYRVLKKLAGQALSEAEPYDVSDQPPEAVNSLVASETLRDLGGDKVTFRHDVLREWAIANLLYDDFSLIETFPLQHAAPPALARGIELAARASLELTTDSAAWESLLQLLTRNKIHGSWRRAALLAVTRSERAHELLMLCSTYLLRDNAQVLRELIRTIIAVEVRPENPLLTALGVDPDTIPASFNFPSSPSWYRLINWLLGLGDALPKAAIPDVVDLYTAWLPGMLGIDSLTPSILNALYRWLTEIESAREGRTFTDFRTPFEGEIEHERLRSLEVDLRSYFLMFSHRAPELVAQYLEELGRRQHSKDAVQSVIKSSGTLAQAAPAELAELTAKALIPDENSDEDGYRRESREPFDFIDHQFFPASPSQGPFLNLLTHAPDHGKALIHQLIEHAIRFFSEDREHGEDAISITFPGGVRTFPWIRSYNWSRDSAHHCCLTSGLMALEGWAHRRIEAGEPFNEVLSDVLGPLGSPAAYLLVAVDLILSHWPESREMAIPFLACPELLCLDRERTTHDLLDSDILGLRTLQREPAGAINIESLKNRPSRRQSLDQILSHFAVFEPFEHRETLRKLLESEASRLGSHDENSNLSDPSFMVVHALNLINPENFRKVNVPLEDGSQTEDFEYVSPEAEALHLKKLQEVDAIDGRDRDMVLQLSNILENPSRSSPEFARAAVDWAMKPANEISEEEHNDDSMRKQAIVTAALVAMRDGDTNLHEKYADWAHKIFADEFAANEDPVHRFREGVRYNPCAIAFVGMVHALKQGVPGFELRDLLEAVSMGNPATAHGFGATASILVSIDERLLSSILRIAFATCIRTHKRWDMTEEEVEKFAEAKRARANEALDAELAWLANESPEPDWLDVPPFEIRQRRRIRLPGGPSPDESPEISEERPEQYFDHQAAALWLSNLRHTVVSGDHPWLEAITSNYGSWTAQGNGAGLEAHEEISNEPSEWNNVYFYLLAFSLRGKNLNEIDKLALEPICSLPDEPFFDVISIFVHSVDEVFFKDLGLDEACAIHIRSTLADRLVRCSGWRWMSGSRKASIETHIAPAIASLLFNRYMLSSPPSCYLLPKGIDRVDPFLPTVSSLVQGGPCLFVAMATLNLLEVSPRVTHLPILISVAKSWFEAFSDFSEFWVDHGIGRRFCELIEAALSQDSEALGHSNPSRADLDRILPGLVSLGVPEARRLEEALM